MFENDKLDLKWSMTFDGLRPSSKSSVAFSSDGSLVSVLIFNPYSITLMNANTGEVRASISSD
jgi:hypothetical protein